MVSSGTACRPLKQIDAINWMRNSPTKRAKESQDELSSVELSALSWADNFMRTTPFDWWDLCSLLPLRIVFYFYLVVLPFFALSAAFVWAPFPELPKNKQKQKQKHLKRLRDNSFSPSPPPPPLLAFLLFHSLVFVSFFYHQESVAPYERANQVD